MATSLLHRTTIITVYKITPKSKLVDLIGLTNLKEKWVGLHLKAILLKSPFLVKIKSLCVNDFHVHKKDSLIFMYIKNKRLLTSVAKIRKVPIYFFYFLKDNSMVHVYCNFVVYSMSLSNFRGGGGWGQKSQQYYVI